MFIAELLSSFNYPESFRRRRVKVYTAAGTQIGFADLGEGDERFTFPGQRLIGDALESQSWAFSTAAKLAKDPTQIIRIRMAGERPRVLVYADGSIAYACQFFGLKVDVLQAVVTQNYALPPIVTKPRHDLRGIRTLPTPRSDSDDEDEWLGYHVG